MQINLIIEQLERLPHEIYKQSQNVLEAKEAVEMKKIEYDVSYSSALITADAPNATEKKAMATVGSSEVKKELVKAEMELMKQEALMDAKNNQWISVRKLASLEEKMMGSQLSGN